MAMIKGIKVILYEKTLDSTDDFGQPTYTITRSEIDNIVIGSPTAEAVVNDMTIYGKHLAYTLAIPKGDTHDWTNAEVEFFGERFRTYGDVVQAMEHLVPLDWNKQVKVERYE